LIKKKSAKKSAATKQSSNADFAATFTALKKLLTPVPRELRVLSDNPTKYELVTKANSWRGGPMWFAGINVKKSYVSFHLLPLYVCPEVAKSVAPELKKRMQGKACFNFRTPDDAQFAQLRQLTKVGLEAYKKKKWL
jgi:hypothetical protein